MSNEYLNKTEEQQFEEAKSWFKENGTPIIVAIILGIAATAGWNFWKNHQIETAQQTSAQYQQVMESYLQDPSKNAPLVEQFINENQHSTYGVFAQLEVAKQAVEKADFLAAKSTLQQALQATEDNTLEAVIRFRLALVDYQLKNYEEALSALSEIKDSAWDQRKQVLTGDILVAKNDIEAAKSAYQQALKNASEQEKALIEVRLNNL